MRLGTKCNVLKETMGTLWRCKCPPMASSKYLRVHQPQLCPQDSHTAALSGVPGLGFTLDWLLSQDSLFSPCSHSCCYFGVYSNLETVHFEFRVSQRFVLGLSSHFDDGNKILRNSKPAGQEPKPQGFGGLGDFSSTPKWKNPGMGHGNEDL